MKSRIKPKLVLLLTGVLLLYYFFIQPVVFLTTFALNAPQRIKPVLASFTEQETGFLILELELFRKDMLEVDKHVRRIQYLSYVPYFGEYVKDLKVVSTSGINLTDAILGFTSSLEKTFPEFTFTGWEASPGSASEISKLASLMVKEFPKYKGTLEQVAKNVGSIDPNRYPVSLRGVPLRTSLQDMQKLLTFTDSSFEELIALVNVIPDVIGENEPKSYLLILQDDGQSRPSGGVLLTYVVLTVDKASISITKQGDVGILSKTTSNSEISESFLLHYLGGTSLPLTESSFAPDFKHSAEILINTLNTNEELPKIDGVVAFDTAFIITLFERFEKDETQKIRSQIQSFAQVSGNESDDVKPIKDATSALLFTLLRKTFEASMWERIEVGKLALKQAEEKHVLAYSTNSQIQNLIEKYNLGARVQNTGGDYLYLMHINTAKHKETFTKINLAVERNQSGQTNTLKFSNNSAASGMTEDYTTPTFFNILVPSGVRIVETAGPVYNLSTTEFLDKTLLSGYTNIQTGTEVDVTIKYTVPAEHATSKYQILLQKQPGSKNLLYTIQVGNEKKEIVLNKDYNLQFDL